CFEQCRLHRRRNLKHLASLFGECASPFPKLTHTHRTPATEAILLPRGGREAIFPFIRKGSRAVRRPGRADGDGWGYLYCGHCPGDGLRYENHLGPAPSSVGKRKPGQSCRRRGRSSIPHSDLNSKRDTPTY